jgi:hypothetical protein
LLTGLLVVVIVIAMAVYVAWGLRLMDAANAERRDRLARLRGQRVVMGVEAFSRGLIVEREGTIGPVYGGGCVVEPGNGRRKRVVPLGQIRWLRLVEDDGPRWGPW